MNADSESVPLRVRQTLWMILTLLVAVTLGYFLAANALFIGMVILGVMWLILLPYHCQISIRLALATFSSALILPFFPGRLFMWEFAALLGWSGLLVTISMRRYSPDAARLIRSNRWLFIGALGYCLILLVTMSYRGFGFRILGGEQMGGRFYFQQLSCAIFPLLFVTCRVDERTVVRLFFWQCVLTTTFLISDFVFSVAPKGLFFLLQFFELPGDALGFEAQAERFGIRRFQSLYFVSLGMLLLMLAKFNLRKFSTLQGLLLLPASSALLGLGFLSGHRYLTLVFSVTLVFCAFAQRFYTFKHSAIAGAALVLLLGFIYTFAHFMPLAAQRAVSFLPGVNVDQQARIDGLSTLETRRLLRKVGMDMAPQYFWMGRGFGQSALADFSLQYDPTGITTHINQGKFYNGIIGLLVNTGVMGTVFMLLFLGAGTRVAWRIIRFLRTGGCEDDFARVCSVLSGLWMANLIAFLLLHGDSEYAMKTFSLQAGLLLVCDRHLKRRESTKENQP